MLLVRSATNTFSELDTMIKFIHLNIIFEDTKIKSYVQYASLQAQIIYGNIRLLIGITIVTTGILFIITKIRYSLSCTIEGFLTISCFSKYH